MTDNSCTFSSITPQDAVKLLASGQATLVDVREPDEFRAEHIAYAMSVPLGQIEQHLSQLTLPTDRAVIFQCLKGKRGENACQKASDLGCQNQILNISGGIDAWKAAGLPVVTVTSASRFTIMQQVQMIVGSLVVLCVLLGMSGVVIGFAIAGILGAALAFAGLTGWCGLAMLLRAMPWNRA